MWRALHPPHMSQEIVDNLGREPGLVAAVGVDPEGGELFAVARREEAAGERPTAVAQASSRDPGPGTPLLRTWPTPAAHGPTGGGQGQSSMRSCPTTTSPPNVDAALACHCSSETPRFGTKCVRTRILTPARAATRPASSTAV